MESKAPTAEFGTRNFRAKRADRRVWTPTRGPQSPARQPPGSDDGAKSVMVLLQKAARAEQKASRLALGARCARL